MSEQRVKSCPYRIRSHDYDGYKQGSFYYWDCHNQRHGVKTYQPCHFNGNKKLCVCSVNGVKCLVEELRQEGKVEK